MNAIVIDIESQKLYPNYGKIWTIVLKKVDGEVLVLNPFKIGKEETKRLLLQFIFSGEGIPIIVTQNGLGFDLWVLWKEYGISFQLGPDLLDGKAVYIFDILYASQFLLPDREGKHSLKSWGVRWGDLKTDYYNVCIELGVILKGAPKGSEFWQYHPKMDEYCEQDCNITEKTFIKLYSQIIQQGTEKSFRNGQKGFWLMQAQSFTGFRFDRQLGSQLRHQINKMIQDVRDDVEPNLPDRKLKKSEEANYRFPASIYKKDGDLSANMLKFINKHEAEIVEDKIVIYGEEYELIPKQMIRIRKPISLDDQTELKDYFLEQGWIPTLWNYKLDPKTKKKMRDENNELIPTTPKIQETQKICPNLLELEGDLAKKIVRFLSLKNRLGILASDKGWLNNPRLNWDGRISAGASGIASTHRWKHVQVVNVPKADPTVLLGKEFRSLWIAEKGFKIVAVDQAALEARVQGHFLFPSDGGKSARELIDGDVHSKNTKAFYPDETIKFDINSPDFNKDDLAFKPYRSKSKNGYYAIIYGCSAKKLGSTLGKTVAQGKVALEAFWKANPALKKLKDDLENFWIEKGEKKWILGIDGRRLYSRSQHSLINLLFQSTGAIVMDYALLLLHNKFAPLQIDEMGRPFYLYKGKIVRRVGYWHDECEFEAEEEIAQEISHILEWAMVEAGRILKLNIELAGESKIGDNWCETH